MDNLAFSNFPKAVDGVTALSADIRDSIPLFPLIKGRRGYDTVLTKAARDLHDHFRFDETFRASEGADVVVLDKSRGKLPNLCKPISEQQLLALKTLLHSLAYIASSPLIMKEGKEQRRSFVAVPMDEHAYRNGAAFAHLNAKAFRGYVLALTHCDWLEFGVPNRTKDGLRKRTCVRSKRGLLDWMLTRGIIFPYHPDGPDRATAIRPDQLLWISRREPRQDKKIKDLLDRPLSPAEQILPSLNKALMEQKLDCPLTDYQQYVALFDWSGGRPRCPLGGRKSVYRVFSGKDGHGGRLYGHWVQSLPKKFRHQLKVNTRETSELDYSSMQLALFYGIQNVPMPEGDLYKIPNYSRDDMKAVLTRSVGNPTRDKTVASLNYMLQRRGQSQPDGIAARMYDAFWNAHSGISPHSPDDEAMWPKLQRLDSRLALGVVASLLDKGITPIPIHDSFIVEDRFAEITKQVMVEEFGKLFPGMTVSVNRA